MPFLSIFTAPKPFQNPHTAIIQRNAIQSWMHLGEDVEVLLVGDEQGIKEVAGEFGIRHLPQVTRNEQGTPLVSSIFSLARQASQGPVLIYANADILILPEIVVAAQQAVTQAERFLMIGQRWDLEVIQPLDFSEGWDERLEEMLKGQGQLHPPSGSDYFLFPRSCFTEIPDFAIGRAGWDNWMIYHARQAGIPLIDATPSVRVIHQNHDYSHLPGGVAHYDLEESAVNRKLAGGKSHMYIVLDSDYQLVGGKVRTPSWSLERAIRKMEVGLYPRAGEASGLRRFMIRRLRRLRRGIDPTRN